MEDFDDEAVFFSCYLHMVWSTKGQRACLDTSWAKYLRNYLVELTMDQDCELIASHIAADHIHLLVKFNPDVSLSDILSIVKSSSSMWIRTNVPGEEHFEWQGSDCAFSVSYELIGSLVNGWDGEKHKKYTDEIFTLLDSEGVQYERSDVLE